MYPKVKEKNLTKELQKASPSDRGVSYVVITYTIRMFLLQEGKIETP